MPNCNYFSIVNYNNVQEGYYSWTGCTGDVNISTIGTLQTQYVCAQDVVEEYYGAPLDITNEGLCPSNTPTPTPTPSVTPIVIFTYNLWSGGYYQNACEAAGMFSNPANVTIYVTKPFELLVPGDNVFGNSLLTIPPINSNFTISNGSRFIQISGTLILNVGVC
jgi:hypothetical protein